VKPLIECVPNFSEGRRPEVVREIVDAMRSVRGTWILDVQSDPDHNRSVVTMVGTPDALPEAAFRGIEVAATRIDMETHRGVHPRLGAADVIPFVPVQGVTMAECVTLARDLGARVGEELRVPVYLYGHAALRADRVRLEEIRRGQYEQLKRDIHVDPDRAPDFGPSEVGSAGAVVVGARPYLVAFNAYLDTDEVSIAKKIARAVRHSSGGYRYVKAMGVLVAGQAQVSMNFTDVEETPLYRVVDTIRREAARYGVSVTHTELVGMIPEDALIETARWHLQMDIFEPDQVIERRLRQLEGMPPETFLDAVAAAEATPGGGSVSAMAGALGAALATMVGRLTADRPPSSEAGEAMREAVRRAEDLRAALTRRVDEDAAAYTAVMRARRLPQRTESAKRQRREAIESAMVQATEVLLGTARASRDALDVIALVVDRSSVHAVTDAGTGAWMALAAVQGAALAIRANARLIADASRAEAWRQEAEARVSEAQRLNEEIQARVIARGRLD
jgi:glutamate formiminotransferase / formiminotetrahydrofolate cyclodeaminase